MVVKFNYREVTNHRSCKKDKTWQSLNHWGTLEMLLFSQKLQLNYLEVILRPKWKLSDYMK